MRFDQNNTQQNDTGKGFAAWRSETTAPAGRVIWPDSVAFRESIQSPSGALADNDLRQAAVAIDRLGMPLAYSGRFAVVFRLTTPRGERWALRCFTSPGQGYGTTRATRYRIIAEHTARMDNTFVPFRYIDRGIRIGEQWYPVVAMRWAGGEPLGRWVEGHLGQPEDLRRLCGSLSGLLERLEGAGIAHGDWQHDNLLISEEGARVTVVDYDGMYVPEFAGTPCPELGHPNYQHPDRTLEHFGLGLDRFACLVIETALLALAHDPSLWARFADGESMLFKKADLADPETSPVFRAVREVAARHGDTDLSESLERLEESCRAGALSTLLPTVAAGPAPSSLVALEEARIAAAARTTPSPPPFLAPLAGRKWWQIPENATATATAAGRTVAARTSSTSRPISYAAQRGYEYLARLDDPETQKVEQWHLWRWRGGAVALNAFLVSVLYNYFLYHNYSLLYFLWVLNFAGMGYGRWPRKRIYEELVAEIAKMENLVADRSRRIEEKGGATTAGSLSDFVAERLQQTSINRILTVGGVQVATLRAMRKTGIDNMLDFKQRFGTQTTVLTQVASNQIVALHKWCEELELEATDEYRKQTASQRSAPVEVDRLRHEMAEFERHAAELKRERDQFPDASFGSYIRKLIGFGGSSPSGAASRP